jgi:hypothetical protein
MRQNLHPNWLASKASRIAAQNTLLELAARKPAKVAGALIENPDIFRELKLDLAKAVLLALIDRGQADLLRQLLGLKSAGHRKASLLAGLLLEHAIQSQ